MAVCLCFHPGLSDTQGYNIRYQYDTSRRLTDVIDDANGGKLLLHVEYDTWSRIKKWGFFEKNPLDRLRSMNLRK